MLIKYYKNPLLAYTTRRRYLNISELEPFYIEENNSIKLGDGARTSIKTSVDNICDYVTIESTRWFVISYTYLNGGQVVLNLQRDVIGEMGIDNCVGKIERGYTDSVLRNRKELSLNQILKKRIPITSTSRRYGNYVATPANGQNDMWGILYFTQDSSAENGKMRIPIPGFTPQFVQGLNIDTNIKYLGTRYTEVEQRFTIGIYSIKSGTRYYDCGIIYNYNNGSWKYNINIFSQGTWINSQTILGVTIEIVGNKEIPVSDYDGIVNSFVKRIANDTLSGNTKTPNGNISFTFPQIISYDYLDESPIGLIIKKEDNYYYEIGKKYNGVNTDSKYGDAKPNEFSIYLSNIGTLSYEGSVGFINYTPSGTASGLYLFSQDIVSTYSYSLRQLSNTESGTIEFPINKDIVDEPYSILAFPLFSCSINEYGEDTSYIIDKDVAFSIFNNVIKYLSGENSFLVDAQIYPYCPPLGSVACELKDNQGDSNARYPFFNLISNTYDTNCIVSPYPYSNIKKEYISREYSILSPEQSSKFTFNFYDYTDEIQDDGNGVNTATITIRIKTALKPFAIISSAVVVTKYGEDGKLPLMGLNYDSDLRGSEPSSNGFECSLTSDAFETYKRQNSNYQALFSLDRGELQKNHETERINEKMQTTMNTLTMAAFGGIAGASAADLGTFGNLFGTKASGAGVGAGFFATAAAGAGLYQYLANEDLRNYEEYLQSERFRLNIGTIKNLPNSVNRISTFNGIIMRDFYYVLETYECSEYELSIVDNFIENYSYELDVIGIVSNFYRDGWFLKSSLIRSSYPVLLHQIAEKELMGGVYIYATF